tara:strand:+ start:201 stop:512 length:312 start_codon:yes stop_codon:yes gene_type:complete
MTDIEKLAKALGVEKITDDLRVKKPDLTIEPWHTADGYDVNIITNESENVNWENDVYYYQIPFEDIIERIKDLDEWSTVYVSDLEEYLPAYEVETWLGTNNYK